MTDGEINLEIIDLFEILSSDYFLFNVFTSHPFLIMISSFTLKDKINITESKQLFITVINMQRVNVQLFLKINDHDENMSIAEHFCDVWSNI